MDDKQLEEIGSFVAKTKADTLEEAKLAMGELRTELLACVVELESSFAETVEPLRDTKHLEDIQELAVKLQEQEVHAGQLLARMESLKDGEDGEQGPAGLDGVDGIDRPLIEPVQVVDNKDYDKNTLGTFEGGLWISTKKAVGTPKNDPIAWHCILDAMSTLSVELQQDHTFKLSVRMSSGELIEDEFHIPYPEHKGVWEENQAYTTGQIVTKGHSMWQAMEDTAGSPPGNGWKQILSAPRGKTGPAGKSITGPQGKPGRNGRDAELPAGFVDDLIALASENKAFEDGRSGSYAVTSFRGYFYPNESYRAGDIVNHDGTLFVCTSAVSARSIAESSDSWEVMLGVPKIAYVPYMHWQGEWNQKSYAPGMVVRDGSWTMVALRDTDERAGPQPIGNSYFAYDGTITPASVSGKVLINGMRYSAQERSELVTGFRLYTTATVHYRVYLVVDPLGTPIISQLHEFTASSTGWAEFNLNAGFLRVGETADLLVVIDEPDPTPVTWTADYNYTTPNNPGVPAAGVIIHANTALAEFRISKTDDGSNDRSTELEALTIGDRIQGAGQDWAITGITDNGTWMNFAVSPSSQGSPDGVSNFAFQTVTATAIPYAEDVGYWTGEPSAKGLYGVDTDYSEITPDDNQYAIDVKLQDYSTLNDWDIVAVSGSGGGGAATEVLSASEINWVRAQIAGGSP